MKTKTFTRVAIMLALMTIIALSISACGSDAGIFSPAATPTPAATATPVATQTPEPTATPSSTSYDDGLGLRLTLPGGGWSPTTSMNSSGMVNKMSVRGKDTDKAIAVTSGYMTNITSSDISQYGFYNGMKLIFSQVMPTADPPTQIDFGDYQGARADGVTSTSDGTDLHGVSVIWIAHNKVFMLLIGMKPTYWSKGGSLLVNQIISSAQPY